MAYQGYQPKQKSLRCFELRRGAPKKALDPNCKEHDGNGFALIGVVRAYCQCRYSDQGGRKKRGTEISLVSAAK